MKTLDEFYILAIKKNANGERLAKFRKTVDKEELKQSAIKDIKELREEIKLSKPTIGDCGEKLPNEQVLMNHGAIEYIKTKNNLTGADLK